MPLHPIYFGIDLETEIADSAPDKYKMSLILQVTVLKILTI